MGYIKRLKLKGFKSFANPTTLNFEPGFNTVVGANGSGKSNVFDALCFVLGRISSKGLRTEKHGHLVFNGGKGLTASRDAEVDLFLSNEKKELMNNDLDEIKISRVVKKSGASTYYLNNNKCTRTQIIEILRKASIDPDGYNIILQGDITKIVNMSPTERRELIEEIANVSGYEEKRQSGLKKLEIVETDLKEADLLMEEKTKYIRELKSEKEQAEKFHQTKKEYRFKNLLLIKSKLFKNLELQKNKIEELQKYENELSIYRNKLDEVEKETKAIEYEISQIEKSIEIASHNDFISVTNSITALEAKIQNLKEKQANNKKQIEELKTKKKELETNIKENIKNLDSLNKEKSIFEKEKYKYDKELQDIDKIVNKLKGGLSEDQFKEIDNIEEKVDNLNIKKLEKNHILHDNQIQIEKLNTKLEHLQIDLKRIDSLSTQNKEELNILDEGREKLKKLIIAISTKSNSHAELSAKSANLQREYSQLIEQHSQMQLRLNASKDVIAQNRAVDTILKFKSQDLGIIGTVSELASVPSKYSMALERVGGGRLFNIVVNNDSTAVKYINYLKENKIGSATFLPLNKITTKFKLEDSVLNKKGVIDYVLNLIKFDSKFENIFHLVFSDTVLIESIENAKGIGIGTYKMVSLDGDLVAKTGAMSGGFRSNKRSIGAFKDSKMQKEVEDIQKRIIILKSTLEHLIEEKEETENTIYSLKEEKLEIEAQIAKSEKILSIEGRDSKSIQNEIENLLSDKTIMEQNFNKIKKEIKILDEDLFNFSNRKKKLKDSSTGGVIKNLNTAQQKRDELKEKLLEIASKIDSIVIQIDNVIIPENVNLKKLIEESEKHKKKLTMENEEFSLELIKKEEEIKKLKLKEKELSKEYKSQIEKRDLLKVKKQKFEIKYEKEFTKFDLIKEKISGLKYAIEEFDIKKTTLNEELNLLHEELKLELIEEENSAKYEELIQEVEKSLEQKKEDIKELQQTVNSLKTKLSSFGSINMKAVAIYDKLNDEFNLLLEKRETLNVEKREILDFIAQIDEKKKIQFLNTFYQLKEHFIETFSKLSTKGKVELNIDNEKDLANSGINIKVRLSKKNYLDIKSLSGGEKTITAIAFIFAVQEFKPASFYIFDEVDSALDIINAENLGKLIKKHSSKAQYIVVSHSEHFIQSSQTIYGVTMNAAKISGVVSLDLSTMRDYVDT